PDFEIHARWSNPTKGGPNDESGIGPCNNDIRRWVKTFPDFRVTIDKMLDAGDLVVCVHTFRGTDSVRIDGRPGPPTGKSFAMPGITVVRVRDGTLREAWTCWDIASMMQQINATPRLGSGPAGALRFIGSNLLRIARDPLPR